MLNRLVRVSLACAVLAACGGSDLPSNGEVTHADAIEVQDSESQTTEVTPDSVEDVEVIEDIEVGQDVEVIADVEAGDDVEVADEVEVADDIEVLADADETTLEDVEVEDVAVEVEDDTREDADVAEDTTDAEEGDAACVSTLLSSMSMAQAHLPSCSAVSYTTNPPMWGDHYVIWPQWKVYKMPVARGFYVHALEHGGIVFAYNCPDGCKADIDALTAMLDAWPVDTSCPPGLKNRFIVTPDPLLDVRFAAVAWEESLEAECMDLDAMRTFIEAHYGRGPERDCIQGADVTNSAIPSTYCPPSCSWCSPPIP